MSGWGLRFSWPAAARMGPRVRNGWALRREDGFLTAKRRLLTAPPSSPAPGRAGWLPAGPRTSPALSRVDSTGDLRRRPADESALAGRRRPRVTCRGRAFPPGFRPRARIRQGGPRPSRLRRAVSSQTPPSAIPPPPCIHFRYRGYINSWWLSPATPSAASSYFRVSLVPQLPLASRFQCRGSLGRPRAEFFGVDDHAEGGRELGDPW